MMDDDPGQDHTAGREVLSESRMREIRTRTPS